MFLKPSNPSDITNWPRFCVEIIGQAFYTPVQFLYVTPYRYQNPFLLVKDADDKVTAILRVTKLKQPPHPKTKNPPDTQLPEGPKRRGYIVTKVTDNGLTAKQPQQKLARVSDSDLAIAFDNLQYNINYVFTTAPNRVEPLFKNFIDEQILRTGKNLESGSSQVQ